LALVVALDVALALAFLVVIPQGSAVALAFAFALAVVLAFLADILSAAKNPRPPVLRLYR
jgi:hypothetical protein